MSILHPPTKALLFVAITYADDRAYLDAKHACESRFGEITIESAPFAFVYSTYYEKEMGSGLQKRFWAFGVKDRESFVDEKLYTDEYERASAVNGRRVVNLDPGRLHRENVILATGKNFSHRVYLARGVYADLTLLYEKNRGYGPLPWTYADYSTGEALTFFNAARERFFDDLG